MRWSLVSKIVLFYVPYRLQDRYIHRSINAIKFNCFLDKNFVSGGLWTQKSLLTAYLIDLSSRVHM